MDSVQPGTEPPQPPPGGVQPQHVSLPDSEDDDEVDEVFEAQLREQQAQWDLEFNTTHNTIAEKSKDDAASSARWKEERAARRAEKQQKLWEEARKKHEERM